MSRTDTDYSVHLSFTAPAAYWSLRSRRCYQFDAPELAAIFHLPDPLFLQSPDGRSSFDAHNQASRMHTIQCVYCDEVLKGKTQAGAMTAFGKHVRKQHSETLEVLGRDVKKDRTELDISK